jgi:hypothetical protein
MKNIRDYSSFVSEKMMLKDWDEYIRLVAEAYRDAPDYDESAVPMWEKLRDSNYVLFKRLLSKVEVVFVSEDESRVGKVDINGRSYPIEYQPVEEQYQSQEEMKASFLETGVLKISVDYSEHPVFSVVDNIVFRTVHDYIVHILGDNDFTGKGEISSYNLHAKLAPNETKPALFTEVVGQACYYLTYGEFPKQKIVVLDGFDYDKVGSVADYDLIDKKLVKRYVEYLYSADKSFQDVFPGKKGEWVELGSDERSALKMEVFEIIDTAYRDVFPEEGHYRIQKPDDVVGDQDLVFWRAVDLDSDPKTDVVIFGSKRNGFKISGWGHDGSREAKSGLMDKLADLFRDESKNVWIEVAGAPAAVLTRKYGLGPADRDVVEALFPDSDFEWLESGFYKRTLGEGKMTDAEIVIGNPKV